MGTIERGETNISFQNLAKLASGLNVTLSTLLSGIERHADKIAKQIEKTKPHSR
jgi:transcriptional regulator with XRE-family HTH domain